ncbi:MAG: TonB-dependent receptor [Cyclobacteriaceae bacterium]
MLTKLLKIAIRMSKLAIYTMIICQTIVMANATESTAQHKFLKEISVELETEVGERSLLDLVSEIESKSDFHFAYSKAAMRKLSVALTGGKWNMDELMMELSKQLQLSIRRVNSTISLMPVSDGTELPAFNEEFEVQLSVSGTVTDENGEGLPGASILEKGTTNGTITDVDGNFSLNVPENAILTVSFVGYESIEVPLNGRSNLDISLTTDISSLEEVVVVGYGTQKKVNVTGAVETMSSEEIEKLNVTQTSQLLTGQMSGVTVTQGSGQPGKDGVQVRVRGIGTFSGAGNSPLILVDGLASSLDRVDFNDIASISVLKDAASAAIYGARGANGVILIETKKGKSGKMKVNYHGYVGFQKPAETFDIVDSWQYAEMENEALTNDGGSAIWTPSEIDLFRNGTDPENYPNARHYDDLIKSGSGFQTNHHLSFQGGSESSTYNISLGYLDQKGIIDETSFQRYNLRANITNKLSRNLSLNLILGGRIAQDNEPTAVSTNPGTGVEGIVAYSIKIPNTIPGRLSNGYYGNQVGFTTEGWMDSESYVSNDYKDIYSNISLDWDITESLKFTLKNGYEFNFVNYELYRPLLVIDQFLTQGPSELTNRNSLSSLSTQQAFLTYDLSAGVHGLTILGGFSQESFRTDFLEGFRDNFPSNTLYELNAASQANQRASGSGSEWALRSFFGRVNYNLNEKYLFEANARYDGSSRFAKDNRYGFFPSVSGGWRLSEEGFFDISWVDELKIRASWGELGNQNIGNYPYQQTFQLGLNTPFGVTETLLPGAAATSVPNNQISWESTRVIDYGMDLTVFEGKLNFSLDYYDKLTSGILYNITASSVLGLTPSVQNAGVVSNKGFDFSLMHQNDIGDFHYSLSANFSYVKNAVEQLANVEEDIANGLFVGSSLESIYGYEALGLFVDQADIDGHATQPRTPQPGDIKFRDISGPQGVPDGIVDATYDRKIIGNTFPKYNFGGTINLGYKGFDLSILLQGVAGVNQLVGGFYSNAFYQGSNPQRWMYENRWTEENPNPKAEYPRLSIVGGNEEQFYTSTFRMFNASYLRINNAQLGYTLPDTILDNINLSNLRIYASVRNLYTFDNLRVGLDPEMGVGYPPVRLYNLGINLGF